MDTAQVVGVCARIASPLPTAARIRGIRSRENRWLRDGPRRAAPCYSPRSPRCAVRTGNTVSADSTNVAAMSQKTIGSPAASPANAMIWP